MFMTTPGFIILVLLFVLVLFIYIEMAKFPGQKARERGHRQADAINVLAWVGLLLGIVPWVVALVWAYTDPQGPSVRVVVVSPEELGEGVPVKVEGQVATAEPGVKVSSAGEPSTDRGGSQG